MQLFQPPFENVSMLHFEPKPHFWQWPLPPIWLVLLLLSRQPNQLRFLISWGPLIFIWRLVLRLFQLISLIFWKLILWQLFRQPFMLQLGSDGRDLPSKLVQLQSQLQVCFFYLLPACLTPLIQFEPWYWLVYQLPLVLLFHSEFKLIV